MTEVVVFDARYIEANYSLKSRVWIFRISPAIFNWKTYLLLNLKVFLKISREMTCGYKWDIKKRFCINVSRDDSPSIRQQEETKITIAWEKGMIFVTMRLLKWSSTKILTFENDKCCIWRLISGAKMILRYKKWKMSKIGKINFIYIPHIF